MPSAQRTHMPEVTELLQLNNDTEILVTGKTGKKRWGKNRSEGFFSFLSLVISSRHIDRYNANNPNLFVAQAAERTFNKW